MHAPPTKNSTNLQSNNLVFWQQMELIEIDPAIVQVQPSAPQRCPMCCSTLQASNDNLLICPNCGLEIML